MYNLLLQALPATTNLPQIEPAWDWTKVMMTVAGPLIVAIIMLVVNHFREGSKQYSNRIKTLESQAINPDRVKTLESQAVTHENRFTQLILERENIVDKFNMRFQHTEAKLSNVDQLSQDVSRLTNEIFHYGKAIEKLDTKFDKIIEALSNKK